LENLHRDPRVQPRGGGKNSTAIPKARNTEPVADDGIARMDGIRWID